MNQADQHQHACENLSSGMDGELSREEMRFLLARLDHDEALRTTWVSYHVVRDSLRRQLPTLAGAGFAQQVMQALDAEDVVLAAPRHRWLRWSAGGAIAAGVAVAALMMVQPAHRGTDGAAPMTASTDAGMPVPDAPADAVPPAVAVVPPWLSGKAPGQLSQRASATFGAPLDASLGSGFMDGHAVGPSPFANPGYRTLDNHDGSYLIVLDPSRQAAPANQRQAANAQ